MWRTNGAGELYTYLPPDFSANQAVCDIPPYSTCNDVYGASVGRGSYNWTTGGRTTVAQRVRLNDAGQTNGELQLFVGGKSVVNVGGLVLRNSSDGRIRGMQMQTFFGGETFSDASVSIQLISMSQAPIPLGQARWINTFGSRTSRSLSQRLCEAAYRRVQNHREITILVQCFSSLSTV